jgi:hypothetical protein
VLVETVGGDARGTRGQIDAAGTLLLGQAQGRHGQRGPDALAACCLVNHDILNPGSQPGRQREDDEDEHADDGALVAGDKQCVGLMVGDSAKVASSEWCC